MLKQKTGQKALVHGKPKSICAWQAKGFWPERNKMVDTPLFFLYNL